MPPKKHILGILFMLAPVALAAPPLWWSTGNPPVIAPGVQENNQSPANIGQAKHIVSQALIALDTTAPTIATEIRADLTAILDLTVPDPKTSEWIDKQNALLLIGQLKAIADPFYTRLHAAHPAWLDAERTTNGTHHPGSIFPWTAETTDDANKAIANIGQLKAVFSLRFETLPPPVPLDTDGDGMPDDFEIANGLNPNDASDANSDADNDGLTNSEEYTYGTNPNNSDSDEDGITDGSEIDQNTSPNDPADTPAAEWFILTGDLDVNEDKARSRTITIPAGQSRLLVIALHSEEYPFYTGDQSEFNDILEWSVTAGEEDPVTGIIDVNSYHDLWGLAEIDGVEIQNFAPALIESTETLTAPGDADLEVEIDLTATNIGDGFLPSTVMVGLLPVDVKDNLAATGVDSVSKTANKNDPGYQEDFWIMAPLQGPGNFTYENLSKIKIGMGDSDVGVMTSANATPDSDTGSETNVSSDIDLDGTHHEVLWQGTSNGIDSEEAMKLKINGDETGHSLPVKIKSMKYREVKVRVYPVRHKQNFAAVPVPNAATFKQELNKIFGYQLNAWITLDIQPEQFHDYAGESATGFADGYFLNAKSQAEQDMINDEKFPKGDADIVVFLIDRTEYFVEDKRAYGSAWPPDDNTPLTTDNVCIVNVWDNALSKARVEPAVIRTVAHEMGHVILGEGHPDVDLENPIGAGVAPLVGTDPKKRLMHKFAYQESGATLLVKKEWDVAEHWLKKFVIVP